MDVRYLPPSEIDAEVAPVDGKEHQLNVRPKFFAPNGPASVGMFIAYSSKNVVLDRVLVQINGKGKISVSHRNEVVVPTIESEKKPSAGRKNKETDDGGSVSRDVSGAQGS